MKSHLKVLLILGVLGISCTNAYARKEIPEHLMKKYGLIDPKVDNRVIPDIKPEDFKPQVRDVKRKKTEHEIPRVKDIHEE